MTVTTSGKVPGVLGGAESSITTRQSSPLALSAPSSARTQSVLLWVVPSVAPPWPSGYRKPLVEPVWVQAVKPPPLS